MTTRFDRDTAVTRLSPGRYGATIDPGWWIINGPNGGYVAAIVLRALSEEVADPTRAPRSLTVHFLRPPVEGPAEVEVKLERVGRGVTTASARLLQGDRLLAVCLGAFGASRDGFVFCDRKPPDLPVPAACQLLRERFPNHVELQKRYETRWGFGGDFGSESIPARTGGHVRFVEPRLVDALAVAAFCDSVPPASLTRVPKDVLLGPVPTIDLTVHFRAALPLAGARDDDYCRFTFESTSAGDGFIEEDGEIWSADGVLLAQSRQLAIVGR